MKETKKILKARVVESGRKVKELEREIQKLENDPGTVEGSKKFLKLGKLVTEQAQAETERRKAARQLEQKPAPPETNKNKSTQSVGSFEITGNSR